MQAEEHQPGSVRPTYQTENISGRRNDERDSETTQPNILHGIGLTVMVNSTFSYNLFSINNFQRSISKTRT